MPDPGVYSDARQKTVSYSYDSDNRLLTKMTDARNNSTQYSYEAATDRLTGVGATVSGQTRTTLGSGTGNKK